MTTTDPHQSYTERMDAVRAELRELLAPQTEQETRIVEWLGNWDLWTLEPIRDMVARRGRPRVRYGRLSADAREVIRMSGVSPADYVRWRAPGGQWSGDRCGCPDDRCIGYHHDEDEQCGCVLVLLDAFKAERVEQQSAAGTPA